MPSLPHRDRSARPRTAGLASALAVALLACRTTAPERRVPDVPLAPSDGVPPRVALVLGGGGARGLAYVGVIRVLEEAGVPVELIAGSSVGSLVGALYAGGANRFALEEMARDVTRDVFFDFAIAPAVFGTGLASGHRLERFVHAHAPGRIEELRIPFAAVATDLDTGEVVVLRTGDIAAAVRASCAIPGVFEPVSSGGRLLVDGGVAANLPVQVARDMGADVIIAVDVTALASGARPPRNFVEVILRAVNVVVHGEVVGARRDADVLLAPEVGDVGFIDFDRKDEAIAAGAESARAALPRIREAIARWRPRAQR
jgi:NTE family protein